MRVSFINQKHKKLSKKHEYAPKNRKQEPRRAYSKRLKAYTSPISPGRIIDFPRDYFVFR